MNKNSQYLPGYDNVVVPLTWCTLSNGVYACTLTGKNLNIDKDSVNVTITMQDTAGAAFISTLTKTFSIDNTQPEVIFLGTDACYENKCYVAPNKQNKIMINMQDATASFERKNVFFSLAGNKQRVTACSGTNCYGYATISCSSGQTKDLVITSMASRSQDDAGNILTGISETDVYCDSKAPVLVNISIEPASGNEYIQSNDDITITAFLRDDLSAVKGAANLSFLGGEGHQNATCSKANSTWKCAWTVNGIEPGPYTEDIKFKFYDTPGNLLETTHEIIVLGVEEGVVPDNWKIQSTTFTPTKINRAFVEYLNTKVYDHIRLAPRRTGVEVLSIRVSQCVATEDKGNVAYIKSSKPDLLNFARGSTNPITIFEFKTTPINEKELEYTCTLEIFSRKGDYTYSEPEKDNFTIKLEVYGDTSELISERVQDEIERLRKEREDSERIWGPIRTTVNALELYCGDESRLAFALGQIGVAGAAEIAEVLTPVDGGATSKGLATTSGVIGTIDETVKSIPGIDSMCNWMTCNPPWKEHIDTWTGANLPWVDNVAKAAGFNNYSAAINEDQSIVMSILNGCLPSFLHNMEKWKALDCEYVRCLAEDVGAGGLPVSQCSENRHFMECKYSTGEIFNLIPFTSLANNIMGQIQEFVRNPATLLGVGLSVACIQLELPTPVMVGCNIMTGGNRLIAIAKLIKKFVDAPKDFFKPPQDACDALFQRVSQREYFHSYEYVQARGATDETLQGLYTKDLGDGRTVHCSYGGCTINKTKEGTSASKVSMRNGKTYLNGEKFEDFNTIVSRAAEIERRRMVYEIWRTENNVERARLEQQYQTAYPIEYLEYEETKAKLYNAAGELDQEALNAEIKENERVILENEKYLEKIGLDPDSDVYKTAKALRDDQTQIEQANRELQARIESTYTEAMKTAIDTYREAMTNVTVANENLLKLQQDQTSLTNEIEDLETQINILEDRLQNPPPGFADDAELQRKIDTLNNQLAQKQNRLTEIEETELPEAQEDLEQAQHEAEAKKNNMRIQADYESRFGTEWGWTRWHAVLGIVRNVNTISSLIAPDFASDYSQDVDEFFAKNKLGMEYWESEVCENWADKAPASGAMVARGSLGYTTSAHVEGWRSEPIVNETGDTIYNYFITGSVYKPKNPGLRFEVYVDPGHKKLVEKTLEEEGESFLFFEQDALNFTSKTQYTEVCIKFLNSNLYEFFDLIPDEDEVCNNIQGD
jgi:hypothetical protein